ncbi:MAG: hypothetical protein HGB35_08955 [Geobacteraceae bacterium]|nr:hypothetical protein [Geobacteraceae bacterium]
MNAVSGFSTQAWVAQDIDCQDRSSMSPSDLGADAFNLNTLDMSAFALVSPLSTGCYTSSESVSITIKNNGTATVDFTVNPVTVTTNVTGAATQSLSAVVNTGSLAAGLTQDVLMTTPLDMTVAGTYTFNAYTSVVGDGNTGNDAMSPATRTVIAPVALPHIQDFDASTNPPAGWNTTGWTIGTTHANPASGNGIYKNLWSSAPSGQINLPKLGPVSSTDVLAFDYRLIAYTSYPATALPNSPAWGSIVVEISTNCGVSYSTLATIDATNHVSSTNWATMTYPLSAYTGSSILLRINASWLAGDYFVDFDNIKIAAPPSCTAPSIQTVTNVATNGADLGWTSPDSFFDIFIQQAATPAPGELTTPTADNVSGNSYTWTGGNAATSYLIMTSPGTQTDWNSVWDGSTGMGRQRIV